MRGWFLFSFDKFELIRFNIPVFLSTERYCVASLKVAIDAVVSLAVTNFLVARLEQFPFEETDFHDFHFWLLPIKENLVILMEVIKLSKKAYTGDTEGDLRCALSAKYSA